ncbi:hypothetical protein B0H65DRAFT_258347 [Neurospora tetraspora]|uniref:Uncharacterized protein n=1 Tax=Neurospora tetraspora TaxID=94610 RepID=A0AAE0JB53_9PEZI|nr:hypothetical protein B0H65DRAFT_258347 [Neurospora tetraspora]
MYGISTYGPHKQPSSSAKANGFLQWKLVILSRLGPDTFLTLQPCQSQRVPCSSDQSTAQVERVDLWEFLGSIHPRRVRPQ